MSKDKFEPKPSISWRTVYFQIPLDGCPAEECLRIPVSGTEYRTGMLTLLYSIYGDQPFTLTLTPQNSYQVDHHWPTGRFVNVNAPGSIETERFNWLGYARTYETLLGDCNEYDLVTAVEMLGPVNVQAKVLALGGKLMLFILIPPKMTTKFNIRHDGWHDSFLEVMPRDEIWVNVVGRSVYYAGYKIGVLRDGEEIAPEMAADIAAGRCLALMEYGGSDLNTEDGNGEDDWMSELRIYRLPEMIDDKMFNE